MKLPKTNQTNYLNQDSSSCDFIAARKLELSSAITHNNVVIEKLKASLEKSQISLNEKPSNLMTKIEVMDTKDVIKPEQKELLDLRKTNLIQKAFICNMEKRLIKDKVTKLNEKIDKLAEASSPINNHPTDPSKIAERTLTLNQSVKENDKKISHLKAKLAALDIEPKETALRFNDITPLATNGKVEPAHLNLLVLRKTHLQQRCFIQNMEKQILQHNAKQLKNRIEQLSA